MRIYIQCASRRNTDSIAVSQLASSDDDAFIRQVGEHIYTTLKDRWINTPHTDVGEERTRMIEKFTAEHRVRVLIEVRYRSGLPFIRLEIDRPDDTPRGALSMKLAVGLKEHLFSALSGMIAANPNSLSDCVFMFDGKIVKSSTDKVSVEQWQKS